VATEYIIYLLGQNLGARTAGARIGVFRGKLRFLSQYFLDPVHQLAHGVELFRDLVDNVDQVLEDTTAEQRLFTVQAVRDALDLHFPKTPIFDDLLRMLIHDAVIGVQDRHHENWGVVTSRERSVAVTFAPLYDSARGLFGNMLDQELRTRFAGPSGSANLERYIAGSRPLIGCSDAVPSNGKFLTHIELARSVFWTFPRSRRMFAETVGRYIWRSFDVALRSLGSLVSPLRRSLILTCVRRRIRRIRQAINQGPAETDKADRR
jgi:hypothetical protein